MNPSARKWRVLIADDVQETRRNTRLMLSNFEDFEVVAIASNGRQAVEMARESRPDVLLLDVNMPEMDGLTALSKISQMFPDMACVFISAENDPITLNAAETLGALAYLTKPFLMEDLENALKHVTRKLQEARAKNPRPDFAALEKTAEEFAKARRTDDAALKIFETLASDPQCKPRWLKTLALMYAIRQEWGKLKALAARLEREDKK